MVRVARVGAIESSVFFIHGSCCNTARVFTEQLNDILDDRPRCTQVSRYPTTAFRDHGYANLVAIFTKIVGISVPVKLLLSLEEVGMKQSIAIPNLRSNSQVEEIHIRVKL